jgi:caffeoyl-CoA O-methyltransferase
MEFLDTAISRYADAHTSPESKLLSKINRETHVEVLKPRMLSGHLQGRLLAMISQLMRPQRVLEIGTYTGYSALCLAEGLAEGGQLHTLEVNEELADRIRAYIAEAEMNDQVFLHVGEALQLIPTFEESWDLVFIDADKRNYCNYYELVLPRMRPGGLLLADNVLWSGKVVADTGKKPDKDTAALLEFNQRVQNDPRVENVLLPVRDGLMMVRKK